MKSYYEKIDLEALKDTDHYLSSTARDRLNIKKNEPSKEIQKTISDINSEFKKLKAKLLKTNFIKTVKIKDKSLLGFDRYPSKGGLPIPNFSNNDLELYYGKPVQDIIDKLTKLFDKLVKDTLVFCNNDRDKHHVMLKKIESKNDWDRKGSGYVNSIYNITTHFNLHNKPDIDKGLCRLHKNNAIPKVLDNVGSAVYESTIHCLGHGYTNETSTGEARAVWAKLIGSNTNLIGFIPYFGDQRTLMISKRMSKNATLFILNKFLKYSNQSSSKFYDFKSWVFWAYKNGLKQSLIDDDLMKLFPEIFSEAMNQKVILSDTEIREIAKKVFTNITNSISNSVELDNDDCEEWLLVSIGENKLKNFKGTLESRWNREATYFKMVTYLFHIHYSQSNDFEKTFGSTFKINNDKIIIAKQSNQNIRLSDRDIERILYNIENGERVDDYDIMNLLMNNPNLNNEYNNRNFKNILNILNNEPRLSEYEFYNKVRNRHIQYKRRIDSY